MEKALKLMAVGAVAVLAADKVGNNSEVQGQIAKVPAVGGPLGTAAPYLVGALVVYGAAKFGLI